MRDRGAFALVCLLIANLWAIAGLTTDKEGLVAMGLIYMFLGIFGVYMAYHS